MVNTREEAREISSRVILLSRRFLNTFVESYGYIYRDKNVLTSVMSQKPFSVMFPTTKASSCIKTIADKISDKMAKAKVKENNPTTLSEAIYLMDDISNDVNMPEHTRTDIWHMISLVEAMKEKMIQ